ncbi:DUF982 domain-containing protein [Rhizobium tubonense]|uniref:DUF982 domain-containing protein n=1 Tax=Rhizobium tubonense TaxID=484088 RepID=UPI003B833C85
MPAAIRQSGRSWGQQAALEHWPNEAGAARHKAEMAVLDVFNEEKSPEEVRQALLDAATAAHLD